MADWIKDNPELCGAPVGIALGLWLALGGDPVEAQSSCLPTQQVYSLLTERHGEARVVVGLAADGASLVEVWGNRETGSFTVFLTQPGGTSCLAMSGVGMQVFQQQPNL